MPAKINLLNQRFGKLTVISETEKRKNNSIVWQCQCDCGNIVELSTKELRNDGIIQCFKCGFNRNPVKQQKSEIGNVYGMFTVLEKTNRSNNRGVFYKCQCKCGNIVEVILKDIKNGDKKSCGCLRTKYHIGEIINNRLILEKITTDSRKPKFKVKCLLCRKNIWGIRTNNR